MKNFHFLKHLFKKGLFLSMLCCSSLGMAQTPSEIYSSGANIGSPAASTVGTVNAVPKSTGDLKSGSLSWAGAPSVTGYFQAGSSTNNIQLTFNGGGLPVSSCGSNKGNITVIWGHTSKGKALVLELNGSAVTGTNTTATVANTVYTAEFPIASSITTINTINLKSSGSSGLVIFSVQVNSCNNTPTLTLAPTSLTGFTCAEGMCPSTEKSFTVEGVNLTAGNISINAPTGYEVSTTSGSGFGSTTSITAAAGTLAAKTVYVRIAGTATQSASLAGDITINGSAVGVTTAQKVGVTGSVTAAPTFTITPNPIPNFSYILGDGPSAVQTLYLSGTNLPAGDIKVAPTNVLLSTTSGGTFASSGITVVSNFVGGTLAPTAFYVQWQPGFEIVGNIYTLGVTPFITDAGNTNICCGYSAPDFPIQGEILPVPTTPTLIVSPTSLTGLDYVFGSGPSAAQTINVSGTLLTATPITITAPTNFEVSLTQASGYAASVQIPNASIASGTLANTPIYVRLATGKAIGSYTGVNATVTGGGDATVYNVALTGAVTPAPLPAPVVGTPTAATEDGFTAHWSTVANATGYIINVYQGGVLMTNIPVAGQATTSKVIASLQPSTTYTYKVIAVGDGTNNINSAESAASTAITTLMQTVVIVSPCGSSMIELYHTNFSDWTTTVDAGSSGKYTTITGGGGDGFSLEGGVTVKSGCSDGMYSANSGRRAEFPTFYFFGGGEVTFDLLVGTSDRTLTITPAPSGYSITNKSTGATVTGAGGTTSTLTKNTAYTVTYTYPTSFTGDQKLIIAFQTLCIKEITVCSNPGTSPILTTTPHYNTEQSLSATIGGNTAPKAIQVKGFNLTGDVTLSIVGDQAGYFAINTEDIDMASALAGKNIWITYTSSVVPSVQEAKLKISSPGAADIYVSLKGISTPVGGVKPVIIADDSQIAFWGSPISSTTKQLSLAGVNLTGDVTITITGTGASKFSISPMSVSKGTATTGTTVSITYTADITSPVTDEAELVITSPGADPVRVPLQGNTLDSAPELYELKFVVSPSGSGFVKASPTGTMYLKGATVTATVIAETGYSLSYWSDAAGNRSDTRTFKVSDKKQGTITVYLVKSGSTIITNNSSFVAYYPDETKGEINGTGFLTQWSSLKDTDETTNPVTKYTVIVYDENNVEIQRTNVGMINSYSVTGLTPGAFYRYEVEATKTDSSTKTTARIGAIQTTPPASSFTCGQ